MNRFLILSIASACLVFLTMGCGETPENPQLTQAVDELRMIRQEMAATGGKDSAEYEIRVALMAFYSYLLKKDAAVPYHIPAIETVSDTERIKRYSYWTPDTYIRDVHYNGDRFDYIEIKDLKIMAYDTDARASFQIVPYERAVRKVGSETRSELRPILVNQEAVRASPPVSPVRLKKLPDEEGEEMLWKVNYRDAFISGFGAVKEKKPGFFEKLGQGFRKLTRPAPKEETTDEDLYKGK